MAKLTVSRFKDLDETRGHYLTTADAEAERIRSQHITPGPGQAMTYEEKHRQALNGGGPMITAEAEALDMTEQEVIDSVLAARAQWEQIGSWIEAARLKAKADIRTSQSSAEMYGIVKNFKETLNVV